MALSYVNYTAGGSDTDYTITFAYLSEDYVEVYLDGVLKTLTTDYTYFNATTIRFNSTVGAGVLVLLKRATLDTSRVVDFQDAGNLTEADLDNSADQLFHLQQEVLDDVTDNSMQLNAANEWDAESHKIINLSDPTLAQDAVTKTWAETSMSSELALAILARTGAETAETAAELAETNAETAQTAAELAETNAETAETGADADLVLTNADVVSTNADVVTTTADVATTNADAATTTQDAIDTAADAVSTAADAVLTAADVVLCDAAYDAFDDRYLGAKASDPTLDNDGNALLTGALYFKTAATVGMHVYNGSAWNIVPGLSNIIEDVTPQLGGDLDVNGNDIVSISNGNINLAPHGTGEAQVGGLQIVTKSESGKGGEIIAEGETTLVGDATTSTPFTFDMNSLGISSRGLLVALSVACVSGFPTAADNKAGDTDNDFQNVVWYGPSSAFLASPTTISASATGAGYSTLGKIEMTLSGTNNKDWNIVCTNGTGASTDADSTVIYKWRVSLTVDDSAMGA